MTEDDNRPLLDGKTFNDPTAWGFCEFCAFAVAVYTGKLIEHRRYRNGHDDALCSGSFRVPPDEIPRIALPKQRVSLRKELERARRKAYWQRQRFAAKATTRRLAEKKLEASKPTKITVKSNATGEEIDLTGMVTGIRLEANDGSTD